MKIENINIPKLKSMTFKLCVGTVLGVSICIPPILAKQDQDFSKYRVETTSTIKEAEKTGTLEVYFNNREYISDKEEYLAFWDDEKIGRGVLEASEDKRTTTFTTGKYNFCSNELGYGTFEIKEDDTTVVILDYKNKNITVTNYQELNSTSKLKH